MLYFTPCYVEICPSQEGNNWIFGKYAFRKKINSSLLIKKKKKKKKKERRYKKTQRSQNNLVMLLFNCETKQDVRSRATSQLFSIDNGISI